MTNSGRSIVFRADSSLEIGSGHVMRCLTLADELKRRGASCHFICREHQGHMIGHISSRQHQVHVLPIKSVLEESAEVSAVHDLAHAHWLGSSLDQDASECVTILEAIQPDWLVVDHYALDAKWELLLKPYYRKLLVIDDLADRFHSCDVLLDQTYGRSAKDYEAWVPDACQRLCGSEYALLRPEFSNLRPYSLKRRENVYLEKLLITMGGVDKDNVTGQVLFALKDSDLPENCQITVVMGAKAPWFAEVKKQAESMNWPTSVRINISDMAQVMAESDLAVGAAGSTSWERCCLGLPTVMIVLADNQRKAASLLAQAQAATVLMPGPDFATDLKRSIQTINDDSSYLKKMSAHAETVTDGTGCQLLADLLDKLDAQT
ncbi:MAG: UDP-2,4-diacetamido-2,4,6-trideoxy-beta-L-altropyranose hydrolase [Pontibacterium sp.]